MSKEIIWLQWEDAFHPENCRWFYEEDIEDFLNDKDFICENVGWIINEDKQTITIASMKSSENNALSHIQKIPKGCIIKKKVLKTND